tara:strand:- start:6969 stop:7247 length:279 start_codon:yes stop_codon:yes gene_type:complete
MRKEEVEIYSDETNRAVLKHPGRNYPGVLIQGDTLYSLCQSLDDGCKELKGKDVGEAFDEINEVRNKMWEMLTHYKVVLAEHNIELPFSETP